MIYFRQDYCFLCDQDDCDINIHLGYVYKSWHKKCLTAASGETEFAKYYTPEEWLEFAGKKYDIAEVCYEYANGTKRWYKKGKLHRLDGPAVEWNDGSKEWYKEGKLHRLDGPAIEWYDGSKFWWIEGIKLSEEYFNEKIASM